MVETRGRARYRPGAFALIYNGDGSGPTYITIAGSKVDAHLVGGVSLAVAAVLIGWGVIATRRGRRPSG